MNKKRLAAIPVLLLSAALGLSGCSQDAGTTTQASSGVTLRVWLVGSDTPQNARDYLKTTFEAQNPGNTLVIEEQAWEGLVDKYTTSLSGDDTPDLVEIGNTQAPTFTSAGYFADLTSHYQDLGGDDLLPGFVEIGSYDGKFYAAPYYSGARVVTYTSQVYTGTVPTTYDEFLADGRAMTTDTISGIYIPGKDWRNGMSYVWTEGGEIATQNSDGTWTGGFSSPESIKGLQTFQSLFADKITKGPSDVIEGDWEIPFCAGTVGFLQAASWVAGSLEASQTANPAGCGETWGNPDQMHQFAMPGKTAGTYAPVLAGGSNIAIAAKSQHQDLAYNALQIMMSDDYQKLLAAQGMVPARISQAKYMPDNEFSVAAANAASAAKLTPASPKWADVESATILEDSFSKIAQGQDVTTVAADMDARIEAILNG